LRYVNIRPSGAGKLARMKQRKRLIAAAILLLVAVAAWWRFGVG